MNDIYSIYKRKKCIYTKAKLIWATFYSNKRLFDIYEQYPFHS